MVSQPTPEVRPHPTPEVRPHPTPEVRPQPLIHVVFDFDCTLTAVHWYWFVNNFAQFQANPLWIQHYDPKVLRELRFKCQYLLDHSDLEELTPSERGLLIEVIFGGTARLAMINQFLTRLNRMGCILHIASKGLCSQIELLLQVVDLLKFFVDSHNHHNISAKGGYPCEEAIKEYYLYQLHEANPTAKIYYIDDDPTSDRVVTFRDNPAIYQYFGANIGLTKDATGLDRPMIKSIFDQIRRG